MLKKSANFRKVKSQVEAENKKSGLCSTLTLTSAYLISLRPCCTAFLSILKLFCHQHRMEDSNGSMVY